MTNFIYISNTEVEDVSKIGVILKKEDLNLILINYIPRILINISDSIELVSKIKEVFNKDFKLVKESEYFKGNKDKMDNLFIKTMIEFDKKFKINTKKNNLNLTSELERKNSELKESINKLELENKELTKFKSKVRKYLFKLEDIIERENKLIILELNDLDKEIILSEKEKENFYKILTKYAEKNNIKNKSIKIKKDQSIYLFDLIYNCIIKKIKISDRINEKLDISEKILLKNFSEFILNRLSKLTKYKDSRMDTDIHIHINKYIDIFDYIQTDPESESESDNESNNSE